MDNPNRGVAGARRRRGKLAAFAFAAQSTQQIATMAITLLAARFLIPADYGVYTLGIVFITLIQTLTYTGFFQFIVTSPADDRSVLSTSFWLILGLSTGSAALLMAAAYPIALLYDAPELAPVLMLLAAIQPVAGISAWYTACLLRRQAMKLHFSILLAQNMTALIGGVLLLWLWQSLYALVAFRYLRVLSGAMLYVTLARARPAFGFDRTLARRATGFSSGLYGARFLNFLSAYGADLLLGLMFSTAEAGLYRFGARIAGSAVDIVAQPMRSFALTQLGAAGRDGRDLGPLLQRFTGSIVLLTGGVAAVVVVLADVTVSTLFNPAYLAGLVVTYAMAVRAVAIVGTLMLEPALAARGITGRVMIFNGIWAGLTVASVFAVAPFGLAALAWSQTAVATLSTLSALLMMKRVGGIAVGGALKALVIASGLALSYCGALALSWPVVTDIIGIEPAWSLLAGLAWATVLAVPTLLIGAALNVFSLRVFSG